MRVNGSSSTALTVCSLNLTTRLTSYPERTNLDRLILLAAQSTSRCVSSVINLLRKSRKLGEHQQMIGRDLMLIGDTILLLIKMTAQIFSVSNTRNTWSILALIIGKSEQPKFVLQNED